LEYSSGVLTYGCIMNVVNGCPSAAMTNRQLVAYKKKQKIPK
jgi:hypothetical protein